jgi:hypothetical protein
MAMIHPAHGADDGCEFANASSPRIVLPGISVLVLAIGLAACAREPAHRDLSLSRHEVKAKREVRVAHVRLPRHARSNAIVRQHAEARIQPPDPALLAPQPAPNCEFKRSDVKTVDANEWARLKTEYERQCYQDAEKAARDRLGQLQTSIARVPQHGSVR